MKLIKKKKVFRLIIDQKQNENLLKAMGFFSPVTAESILSKLQICHYLF